MSFNTDKQPPSSKSPYLRLYSLPNISEIGTEDDWTQITDRKAKKRIQNRVAQRSYRQRMRSRIEELQARVELDERSMRQSAKSEEPFADSGMANQIVDIQDTQPAADGVAPWTAPAKRPAKDGAQSQAVQQSLHKPSLYDVSKTVSTPYPQQTFPQSYPTADNRPVVNVRPYDKTIDNSMQLPRSLAGDSSNQDGAGFPQLVRQREHAPPLAQPFGRASQMDEETSFMPDNLYGQPLLNHLCDSYSWKTDNLPRLMRQNSFPTNSLDTVTQPSSSSMAHMAGSGLDSPSDSAGSPTLLDHDASIRDRFECIMELVNELGFGNFDSLVIAYYGETFTESSQLANEQRLSRNRRLPKAIADIFNASKDWSAWERRGFLEEILRSTEAMLVSEKKDANSAFNAGLAPLMMATGTVHGPGIANLAQHLQALKKTIPRELPNLWTIMLALAASNDTAWQQDSSGSALAATLLLHCAGRVPKEQLLALIGACF